MSLNRDFAYVEARGNLLVGVIRVHACILMDLVEYCLIGLLHRYFLGWPFFYWKLILLGRSRSVATEPLPVGYFRRRRVSSQPVHISPGAPRPGSVGA